MIDVSEFRAWLAEDALPLWAEHGQCPRSGAFYESIAPDGAPNVSETRRVRVQFRQIYAFSAAYALGFGDRYLETARRGFHHVLHAGWARDGGGGWCHTLHPDGSIADPLRDAYDHAFAILGLSWYYRVSGDRRALTAARRTQAYLDGVLRAINGGWREDDRMDMSSGDRIRRQNPHMHMFEALMATFEATQLRGFLARAGEHFTLFATHFFDQSRGVLREYFDVDWTPLAGEAQSIEPGHMAEWVWLLRDYQRHTKKSTAVYADALFERLCEIGMTPCGRALVDALDDQSVLSTPTRRLWPQTELFRACCARIEAGDGAAPRRRARAVLDVLFDDYFSGCVAGGWRDRFDLDGRVLDDRMPASSLYHIVGAYAAANDVAQTLADGPQVVPFRRNASA